MAASRLALANVLGFFALVLVLAMCSLISRGIQYRIALSPRHRIHKQDWQDKVKALESDRKNY